MNPTRWWRLIAGTAAGLLVLVALLLTALRIAIAYVPQNEQKLRTWIERQTQMKFEYSGLDTRLRWYGPEVVLRDLRVLDADRSQAMFVTREGTVGLDLWNFLRTGELVAGRIRILEPRITVVRLADGRIRLLGLRERPADRPPFDFDRLPAGRLIVEDAVVVYRDLKAGRTPIEFTRLDVQLRRDHDSVVMEGNTKLPQGFGTTAGFRVRLKGSLDVREQLDARVEVDADQLQLASLKDFVPSAAAVPSSGAGPVRAVLALRDGRVSALQLEFALREVALTLPARNVPAIETVRITAPRLELAPGSRMRNATVTKQMVPVAAPPLPVAVEYGVLEGDLKLRRENDSWVFRLNRVRARPGAGTSADTTEIWGRWSGKPASSFALDLNVDRLDLGQVWPLVLAFGPPALDRFAGLAPRGRVQSLRAQVARERAGLAPTFTVKADLAGIGVQPHGRFPGLSGVSLLLDGNDHGGTLQLRGEQPVFEWPRLFGEPLVLERVAANGGWRRDGARWITTAQDVELEHQLGRAKVDVEFEFERSGVSPILTLDAEVPEVDVTIVPKVLPVGRMRERTIAWLDRAFVAGTASNGRLRYHGPVRKFPFRDGEGEFIATADVNDATLDYYPGFAPVTRATGAVRFHNASIEASLTGGELGGLKLNRVKFLMAEYRAPVLQIDGQASGDLRQALAYLQGSPLGPTIGDQFMSLTGSGPARYDVMLTLPTISDETLATLPKPWPLRDYRVRTMLDGVTVALPALRAPVQRVQGEFELHNYDVRAAGLRGRILDGPFELSASPGRLSRDLTAAIDLTAQGRAAGTLLPAFIGLPAAITMSGATDWQLQGRIEKRRSGGAWPMRFDVASSLGGLVIKAPQPFAKTASETRPTRVRLELPGSRANDVSVESGSARARLRFLARDSQWRLERGAARFDGQPVSLPAQSGLLVSGDWPQFDLGEWLALSKTGPAVDGGQRLMDWLGPVDVHLDRATVFGFEFNDVIARLRVDGDLWRVAVGGPRAVGEVTVPDDLRGGRPIELDMKLLALVSSESAASAAAEATDRTAVDPRTVPAIRARVDDFSWQSRRFGRLEANLARVPLGLTFEAIKTAAPSFEIAATGSWLMEQGGPRTRLEAEFGSTDFSAAARSLAYRDVVDAAQARIVASLWWPGGPSTEVLKTMNGALSIDLQDGRLREIEPGAGRVLGLLSIAQLPRRLALDFRDVTEEGLAFNSVQGDFEIRSGNAYTQNLLLKGPAVDMGIVGRTGLGSEDYDQTLVVSGNPTGPLAVAGALAAGPVIGAGVLVLSQLFKDQLQGLTRAYYHVSGPWAAPVVKRISAPPADEGAADRTGATTGSLP